VGYGYGELEGSGGGMSQADADTRYVNETDHTKAAHDALGIAPGDGSVTRTKMSQDNRGTIICTSTTRPTGTDAPEGQHIYETDTDKTLKNTGTPSAPVWSEVGGGASSKAVGTFHAHNTVDQLDIPTNTFVRIVLDGEVVDREGWFASSRFSPLLEGYYEFWGGFFIGNTTGIAGKQTTATLYKNGVRAADLMNNFTSSGNSHTCYGMVPRLYLVPGDFVDLYCWHALGINTADLIAFGTTTTYLIGGYVGGA
jgi:hypothetical protein